MRTLDPRKEKILNYIVDSYVESVNPVGSRVLMTRFRLKVSSSTIRNEMGELEEMGYITHPHTSAGRIPTDKGYRYFVDHLRGESLSKKMETSFGEAYRCRIRSAEELLGRTLEVLSTLSHQTSLIFMPELESFVLRSVSLVRVGGNYLAAIWLSMSGFTKSSLVDMKVGLSDGELSGLNRFLNEKLSGLSYQEIHDRVQKEISDSRDSLHRLYEQASRIIEESLAETADEKIYLEGSSRILAQPEFQRSEAAQPVLSGLEEKTSLRDMLRDDLKRSGVRVRIGSETGHVFLKECSLISAPYSLGTKRTGVLGILGPRRMRYSQTIPLVSLAAQLMSGFFERWFE